MSWHRYVSDPDLRDFAAVREVGVRALVRRGYESYLRLPGLLQGMPPRGETVSGGRTPHPVVALPTGEWVVVREYRRGGMIRHFNRRIYLFGHRAMQELLVTERASCAGVRVPTVIAAIERRSPVGYTARLVTRRIEGVEELASWLGRRRDGVADVFVEVGRQVALAHRSGITHPDLNLRNLLVGTPVECGARPPVYLIDFDRARIVDGGLPPRRRGKDLLRLARSARKLRAPISRGAWMALRDGYGAEWPLPDALG